MDDMLPPMQLYALVAVAVALYATMATALSYSATKGKRGGKGKKWRRVAEVLQDSRPRRASSLVLLSFLHVAASIVLGFLCVDWMAVSVVVHGFLLGLAAWVSVDLVAILRARRLRHATGLD